MDWRRAQRFRFQEGHVRFPFHCPTKVARLQLHGHLILHLRGQPQNSEMRLKFVKAIFRCCTIHYNVLKRRGDKKYNIFYANKRIYLSFSVKLYLNVSQVSDFQISIKIQTFKLFFHQITNCKEILIIRAHTLVHKTASCGRNHRILLLHL